MSPKIATYTQHKAENKIFCESSWYLSDTWNSLPGLGGQHRILYVTLELEFLSICLTFPMCQVAIDSRELIGYSDSGAKPVQTNQGHVLEIY